MVQFSHFKLSTVVFCKGWQGWTWIGATFSSFKAVCLGKSPEKLLWLVFPDEIYLLPSP